MGRKDRKRRNGINNLRNEDHAADISSMSSCFVRLRNDQVYTSGLVAFGMAGLAGQGRDPDTAGVSRLNHIGRRRPQGTHQQLGFVSQGDINNALGLFLRVA